MSTQAQVMKEITLRRCQIHSVDVLIRGINVCLKAADLTLGRFFLAQGSLQIVTHKSVVMYSSRYFGALDGTAWRLLHRKVWYLPGHEL